MRSLLARLVDTFRRRRLDRELDDEIAIHLELAASEMEANGMSRDVARWTAMKHFGGVLRAQEADREVRGFPMLDTIWSDLRYAVRGFLRTPASTAFLLLTLAMGIGVTTAIFSVVYGVLLKPLPFDAPDRLVALNHLMPGFAPGGNGPQSAATYFTYRDHGRVFDDIGMWSASEVSVTSNGTPERVEALRVTDGVLPLLRIRASLGTLLSKEDDVPGAPDRVLLTHRYWLDAFGGAPDVLGRLLTIDAAPYEIIGVLPQSFTFLNATPAIVLPLRPNRAQAAPGAGFGPRGIARLKPGVTLSQANGDIARMIPLIVEEFPLPRGVTREMWDSVGLAPNVRPLSEEVIGDVGRFLWILLATAGIVLLIACANVANLLLVRGEGRLREFAVRSALGASSRRIARQLVSESVLLALCGGALGVLFAEAGVGALRRMAPAELPRVNDIAIDGVVLGFTLGLSILTAFVFGTLPLSRFSRISPQALKEDGRSTSEAPGRHRMRNTLVVAQLALALVLLIVSGLMVRTFVAMQRVQPGFVRPAEVQTFRINLPPALVSDPQQLSRVHQQIVDRLKGVPGVSSVGLTSKITMDGLANAAPIFVQGRPFTGTPPARRLPILGPGYFETMGNGIVVGRTITWTDILDLKPVALVSANLARELFEEPTRAVGKQIGGTPDGPWYDIVGVVGDERDEGLNHPAPPMVYMPMGGTFPRRNMAYVVRSPRTGTPGFVRELQRAVSAVSPDVPLGNVRTLEEIQASSMAQTSFAMVMLGIGAGVALLLSLIGIYGVVSYVAAERTHEVGIRMALGAHVSDVRRLFLRQGLVLAACGIVLGLGAAVLLTPVMSALLYGVGPTDPITYAAVSIALGVVALLATYLPARRASRVQPIVALRSGM